MSFAGRFLFFNGDSDGREEDCLLYVKTHAQRGNATDVYHTIDEYGWTKKFLMNVGDDKGDILIKALEEKNPRYVLELGAYVGYSE
jgi:catechol O-methyltransferase